jgi:hypothetical protein
MSAMNKNVAPEPRAFLPSSQRGRQTNSKKHETKMYEIRQIVTLFVIIQKYSMVARCSTDDVTYFLYQNKFRLNSYYSAASLRCSEDYVPECEVLATFF